MLAAKEHTISKQTRNLKHKIKPLRSNVSKGDKLISIAQIE
jgi:hypothetical protein